MRRGMVGMSAGIVIWFSIVPDLASAVEIPNAADYTAAAQLLEGNLRGLVLNESIDPHWIDDAGRFWYRSDGGDGPEFWLVMPDGQRLPAFNHDKLALALNQALKSDRPTTSLLGSMRNVQLNLNLGQLTGEIEEKSIECKLARPQCKWSLSESSDASVLYSPDRSRGIVIRNHNLWVRDTKSGIERQLTTDGTRYYSWAGLADTALVTIPRKKSRIVSAPHASNWSPDGRYLLTRRIDERGVGINPFVEWIPTDGSRRPIVYEVRQAFAGDAKSAKGEFFLFDLASGRRVAIAFPEPFETSPHGSPLLDWDLKRSQAFLLVRAFANKSSAVFRLNLLDGNLTKVVEDTSATHVENNTINGSSPNVRILNDGSELVWYSDRTGYGHLYLYDAQDGRLKNAITEGDWLVHDIVAIDDARREIFFTAGGREPGRDPYLRHLYRGSLDNSRAIVLLTEPDADHDFDSSRDPKITQLLNLPAKDPLINAKAGIFVDTWSTVNHPPVSALRSTRDGRLIVELERADASRLFAAGWQSPIRERVKAADAKTDLYVVYYPPHSMQAGARVPVIDAAYGGPQGSVAPRNFKEAYAAANPLGQSALSRLGFAVVTIDGRGTKRRSRAFRDAGYTSFTQVGIDDHVAAIRELAGRHSEIDLERVGVYGWSWGGTFAAQAILSQTDFYKVSVSGAGIYDYAAMYPGWEVFTGPPVFADGTRYRGNINESPSNWNSLDVTRMADRLTGKLLIIYTDMDENVPPVQAFRMIDALTQANKRYDLIYVPNRNHVSGMQDGYVIQRTWDYFIEHLLGADPAIGMRVEMRATAPGW